MPAAAAFKRVAIVPATGNQLERMPPNMPQRNDMPLVIAFLLRCH
jgi:hypothetical protein